MYVVLETKYSMGDVSSGACGCLREKAHDGKRCPWSQEKRKRNYRTEKVENGTLNILT